ncbi:MAG: hydroxylase [Streptosporangiales bacterium]|nr:hydroxylase [Streptosporangiales bacterium]
MSDGAGQQPPSGVDPALDVAVADLLGVLAYAELVAFERLAAYSRLAPSLIDKAALAELAVVEFRHCERLVNALAARGLDPEVAMQPFVRPLDDFHAKTSPNDWLEGLVKAYVGDGLAGDFYAELASVLDPDTRELVGDVVGDSGHATFVVDRVRKAIEEDPTVAGRLALWARRIVGEALVQAQRVAADRDALAALLVGRGDAGADLAELGKVSNRLLENHNDRMTRLGLTS